MVVTVEHVEMMEAGVVLSLGVEEVCYVPLVTANYSYCKALKNAQKVLFWIFIYSNIKLALYLSLYTYP